MADYDALCAVYQRGDILFGLSADIAAAVGALRAKRKLTGTKRVTRQSEITDAVWDHPHKRYSTKKQTRDYLLAFAPAEHTHIKGFRGFLEGHEKYNVGDSHGNPSPSHPLPTKKPDDSAADMAFLTGVTFSRTSKAGLEYHLTTTSGKIHFIVTSILLQDIVAKTGHGVKGNVTSAELRWLYRHPTLRTGRVRFWKKTGEITAYMQDPLWQQYHPKAVH